MVAGDTLPPQYPFVRPFIFDFDKTFFLSGAVAFDNFKVIFTPNDI
jgi:hypothetical protein